MRVHEAIERHLYDDKDLVGIPRPVLRAVAEATLRHLAGWANPSLLASEVDAIEVEMCEGARCSNLIDPQSPDGAKFTEDGWFCDACIVEEREKDERARDAETSRRTDKS